MNPYQAQEIADRLIADSRYPYIGLVQYRRLVNGLNRIFSDCEVGSRTVVLEFEDLDSLARKHRAKDPLGWVLTELNKRVQSANLDEYRLMWTDETVGVYNSSASDKSKEHVHACKAILSGG